MAHFFAASNLSPNKPSLCRCLGDGSAEEASATIGSRVFIFNPLTATFKNFANVGPFDDFLKRVGLPE
ncbi:hypothetical protein [Bradyrhizobium sp.]|uniref:hypothetical protein n=1 Tax=Bradyrhizobium sp. TaxID=376 RepID=UPI002619C1FA|nr:hypothetical protein [Bradyrhizobium sp.]